jgi:hypothetical protein
MSVRTIVKGEITPPHLRGKVHFTSVLGGRRRSNARCALTESAAVSVKRYLLYPSKQTSTKHIEMFALCQKQTKCIATKVSRCGGTEVRLAFRNRQIRSRHRIRFRQAGNQQPSIDSSFPLPDDEGRQGIAENVDCHKGGRQ